MSSEEEYVERGDGDRYGLYTGNTRSQFIVALFDAQIANRLTDEQLVAEIDQEFPKSNTPYTERISGYRNRYNRGDWSSQTSPPGIMIMEFNDKGEPIDTKPGPSPRMPWEEPERRKDD